jgi:hypothetical protein
MVGSRFATVHQDSLSAFWLCFVLSSFIPRSRASSWNELLSASSSGTAGVENSLPPGHVPICHHHWPRSKQSPDWPGIEQVPALDPESAESQAQCEESPLSHSRCHFWQDRGTDGQVTQDCEVPPCLTPTAVTFGPYAFWAPLGQRGLLSFSPQPASLPPLLPGDLFKSLRMTLPPVTPEDTVCQPALHVGLFLCVVILGIHRGWAPGLPMDTKSKVCKSSV